MRVAFVAESFLPNINGVSNSVVQVVRRLREQGHDCLIIAPGARDGQEEISTCHGARVLRVPTVMMPRINSLPIGVPSLVLGESLRDFAPDVIHLASPFVLGAHAAFTARAMRIPTVAVFQTDVAGYTTRYHLSALRRAAWAWTRTIHNACTLTLAPSTASIEALRAHSIRRVYRWSRGVDTQLFHPGPAMPGLRVGYVGRLAAEKELHKLKPLDDAPNIKLVIVGDGPQREELARELPHATFTGALYGEKLAQAYRSFDVFVHPGQHETFCQTIQEAHASGVPTITVRSGGPMDLVRDGVNGVLLKVEDFEAQVVQAVEKVVDFADPAVIRESVQHQSWEAKTGELLQFYRQAKSS